MVLIGVVASLLSWGVLLLRWLALPLEIVDELLGQVQRDEAAGFSVEGRLVQYCEDCDGAPACEASWVSRRG